MFTLTASEPVLKILSGKVEISFQTDYKSYEIDALTEKINSLNADKLTLKVSKFRKGRSLDANDYLWVLCTKLAQELNNDKLCITKEDIYRKHIRDAGVYEPLAVPNNAVERFGEAWGLKGIGWFVDVVDSKLDGCKKVFAYYGSSTYNTQEMSRLIDSVVQDCKAVGVETMTPNELQALKEAWKGER